MVFFLLSTAVGGSLALESSYLPVTLASHIGLALVTLGLAAYAASVIGRSHKTMPRASAGLSAISALGATIAGTIFLMGGQSTVALYAMEGLAGIGILAALLMIVFGGPSGKRASVPPLPRERVGVDPNRTPPSYSPMGGTPWVSMDRNRAGQRSACAVPDRSLARGKLRPGVSNTASGMLGHQRRWNPVRRIAADSPRSPPRDGPIDLMDGLLPQFRDHAE